MFEKSLWKIAVLKARSIITIALSQLKVDKARFSFIICTIVSQIMQGGKTVLMCPTHWQSFSSTICVCFIFGLRSFELVAFCQRVFFPNFLKIKIFNWRTSSYYIPYILHMYISFSSVGKCLFVFEFGSCIFHYYHLFYLLVIYGRSHLLVNSN